LSVKFKIIKAENNFWFLFFKDKERAYLLKPVTIKTDIGNIYLKKFEKIRLQYENTLIFSINNGNNEHDLTIFGEKINNVIYIALNQHFHIYISPQSFRILNSIDEAKNKLIDEIYYNHYEKTLVFVSHQNPEIVYSVTMTLDGEVLKEKKDLYFESPAPELSAYNYTLLEISEEERERLSIILYETEEGYLEQWLTKILLIQKVNFAVPGGDNYMVLWEGVTQGLWEGVTQETYKNDVLILYSISDKIENRYDIETGIPAGKIKINFDIMENIPGIHIGNTIRASVCDFNGDGIDELFCYGFYGMANYIHIYGYDVEENEIVDYCYFEDRVNNRYDYVYFEISDKGWPVPVEFTRYKGRNGFKVFCQYDPKLPPVNLIDGCFVWYFYAWNPGKRRFENLGEYLQEGTATNYNIHNYHREYFKNRILIECITGGMEGIIDLMEIDANIEGGRSFKVVIEDHTKEVYEKIIDFDSDGLVAYK
jgi:hypothetical protein